MVRGLLLALPKLDLFSYLSEEDMMYCWVAILSVDVPSCRRVLVMVNTSINEPCCTPLQIATTLNQCYEKQTILITKSEKCMSNLGGVVVLLYVLSWVWKSDWGGDMV